MTDDRADREGVPRGRDSRTSALCVMGASGAGAYAILQPSGSIARSLLAILALTIAVYVMCLFFLPPWRGSPHSKAVAVLLMFLSAVAVLVAAVVVMIIR